MDKDNDIYKKAPGNGGKANGQLPLVELTPAQVKSRTIASTLGFVLIMLVLLGGATWFIHRQEEERKLPDEPEAPETLKVPFARPDEAPAATTAPRVAIPEPVGTVTPEAEAQIDPERMAQAMGEVRTANEYLHARNWNQAEVHARKALEIWPDMNAALRLLGVVHTQRGQFDQAIVILEKALQASPFNVEIYNNLATAYMQKGQYEKSEELLQTSLQIMPGYRIAFLNLGLLALLRGNFEAAADYLERSLEQVPDDPPPRNNLAVALIRLGRYDEAREHLQYIIDRYPELPNAYFNMAITYVLENRFPEAMNWIRTGGERCSPIACQQFLADSDFNAIRGTPEFQAFIKSLYPDLPTPPEG